MNAKLRFSVRTVLSLLLGSGSLGTVMGVEGDWPQWRGPDRDGRAAPQKLLDTWPADGPKLAWSFLDAGAGFSSIAVADGQLFTLGKIGNRTVAICLDANTGKKIWEQDFADAEVGKTYSTGWGDGPRSTPTIDGDRIYCLADLGTFACLDRATGKVLWTRDFVKEFGGKVPQWGYSESVLIDGDKVIATPGGPNFLVGFNKMTGEKVWESKNSYEAQYASILKGNFEGIPAYVTAAKPGLIAVHAETGEELFVNSKTGNQTAVIPTPIISGNRIYHSSGYGAGNVAVDVKREGDTLVATEVFAASRQSMENHHGGFVLHDGTIFGFSRAMRGVWMAQDLKTGEVLWHKKVGSAASGSIAFADGNLYCYDDADGTCYLAKASKTGWEPVGQVKLPEQTAIDRGRGAIWSHPVVAANKLFIRDLDKLFAFEIGE